MAICKSPDLKRPPRRWLRCPDELKDVLSKMTPDQLAALKEQISKMQAKDVDAEETAEEEEEAEEVEEAKEEYEDDPQE